MNDNGWPQQPPTEKVLKFNMIFPGIFHNSPQKDFFSKHKNKAEFKCLDDYEVLSSDFPGLKTSTASLTSLASTTPTAFFYQRIKYEAFT